MSKLPKGKTYDEENKFYDMDDNQNEELNGMHIEQELTDEEIEEELEGRISDEDTRILKLCEELEF